MNMKKNLILLSALFAALTGCTQKYELNSEFTMPDELVSPEKVVLNVTSAATVELSWTGSHAADGGVVLYDVLFDKEGGDFSEPVVKMTSDRGAESKLTLTHADLNTIARKAGIKPNETGSVIWTITGSKGGITKRFDGYGTITITRGDGIDSTPEILYINGSAAKEAGQAFRMESEGRYVIFTRTGAGDLFFTSEPSGGTKFYADATGKITEGEGKYTVETASETGLSRITVDFNTLSIKMEDVSQTVRLAWGISYDNPATDAAVLEYAGNGEFKGTGEVTFSEQSWGVEERYYFIAEVNGSEVCWGSDDGTGAFLPDGTEEHFYIYENAFSQWSNLWKMDHAMDQSNVAFTIYTNKDNKWTHTYEKAGAIVYEQPASAPAELYIYGSAAETEGAAFRKAEEGVFVIYQQLKAGKIRFGSGEAESLKYFHDADNKLFIGSRDADVAASEGVTRVTVDFNTNTVKYDQIGKDVTLIFAWTQVPLMTLSYQGNGRFAGEGNISFINPGGWMEERYNFRATVNGSEVAWGRIPELCDGENRPDAADTPAGWFYIGEYPVGQWDNLWKFASELENSVATCTIDTNADGAFTHSFMKASVDPVPPTMVPSELALYGSGAEAEGQKFRMAGNGVFEIYAKLKDGEICFKSSDKNYFLDAEKGLLQGEGKGSSTSSGESVTRIRVNFSDNTVSFASVDKVRCIYIFDFNDVMTLSYKGQGTWEGEGTIAFRQASWGPEERYYFIPTINGAEEKCWGRKDGVTDQQPDGSADFFDIVEFGWSQWDHAWKFASDLNGAAATIRLESNKNGVMTHSVTKK